MSNSENFTPKIKEIVFLSDKKEGIFCESFVFEPDNIEEHALGRLFMIGVLNERLELSSLINLLVSVIKRGYYINTKREPLAALETALKKANTVLAEFITAKKERWPLDFGLICASLTNNTLYLAQIGNVKSLLYRDGQISNVGKRFNEEAISPNPLNTFQNIASGKVIKNDRLVFVSTNLFRIITREKFRNIFSPTNSLDKVNKQILEALNREKREKPLNVALLVVSLENPDDELAELAVNLNLSKDKNQPYEAQDLTLDEIIDEYEQPPLE